MAPKRKRSKKSLDMRIAKYYKVFFGFAIVFAVLGIVADITIVWWIGLMFLLMGAAYKRKVRPINPKDKKRLMIFTAILVILMLIGIAMLFFVENDCPVSNFKQCVGAGYPVMESYPMQCKACGRTFVQNID